MLKIAVLVSGGGTNLQAIIDAIDAGTITNAQIDVVISNNPGVYALERAKNAGIEAMCLSPKEIESREKFNDALTKTRDALKDIDCKRTDFSLGLFSGVTLTGGRTFTVNSDDIDFWLDHYEKGPNTFVLLSLLYQNLKLSQVSFHLRKLSPP